MDGNESKGKTLLVSGREAAQILGVSERTLFNLRKRGELKFVPIGARILYQVSTLGDFASRRETALATK